MNTPDTSFTTQGDTNIAGDVIGRDKIVTTYGYTAEQVSTLLTQLNRTFQPQAFDGRCPYLGLEAFREDDADRFFGREALVADLVARIDKSRWVVVTGPSGSGKSSLVRAGLLHALKRGALAHSDRWLYATLTPGRDPIEALALALARLAQSPDGGKYVRAHAAEPGAVHEFVESQLSDHQDQRAVIFVDQFEEVFTQVSSDEARLGFLKLLTYAATVDSGRVTVVFAMRSDFVSNCAAYPQLNALLNQQFMQVGAMQPDELVSAIARPALQVGLRIDPDLVAQIVNDMQDEPGALPLLQFALKDLFDARQARGDLIALTLNDYLARGGLRKALERHADAAFAQLTADEQQLARTIFSGLIEVGRGTQDTRRTAAFDELVPLNVAASQVAMVIQKLADARLIITAEQGDTDTVTIAHERLIGAWPWLQRLVTDNREALALQHQIAADAQEWAECGREASYLYGGARLANACEQLAARKIVLSGQAHAFVTASTELEEAQRQLEKARRQKELADAHLLAESEKQRAEEQARSAARLRQRARYLIGALGMALVLGVVAGVFGVQSSQNASVADRHAATAQAASTLAVANARTAEAASTQAVSEAHIRATAEINANRQRDEAQRQAALADSRRLAALALNNLELDFADPDYPVRILALQLARAAVDRAPTDEAESALRAALRLSQPAINLGEFAAGSLRDLQFSPDSRRVVVVQTEAAQDAWVFDLGNGQLLSRLTLSDGLTSLIFTPDSQGIATSDGSGVLQIWDISAFQARERFKWAEGEAGVSALAYSPDGRRLLIIGDDSVPRVLNADNGQLISTGPRLNGHVFQAIFSADGGQVLTVAGGDDVKLWEASTGAVVADVLGPASAADRPADIGTVVVAHLSPDGEQVLMITTEGLLLQWTAATQTATVRHDLEFAVQTAAFSNDGLRLGLLGSDQSLALYAVDAGQVIARASSDVAALHVAFSPDNQRLITFGYHARLWAARDGAELAVIDGGQVFPSGSAALVEAAISPDSQVIALYGEGYAYPPMRFEPVYMAALLDWSRRLAPNDLTCDQQAQYQVTLGTCATSTPAVAAP